ncbi:MAG: hypothetical protein C0599_09290, partial [Salinivirgaceae bacterium]
MKKILATILFTSFAILLFGQSIEKLKKKAEKYYTEKNYTEAINYYTQIINKGGGSGYIYNRRGICYDNLGKLDIAIEDQKKALEFYKDNSKNQGIILSVIGGYYLDLKDYEQSSLYFKKAIEKTPDQHSYYWNYGASLANLEKTEDAIEAYKKALNGYSDSKSKAILYKNIAFSYQKIKDYQNSIAYFKYAIDQNTNDRYNYYWNLGYSYSLDKQYQNAIENYQLALKGYQTKNEEKARILAGIGNNYGYQKKYDKAVEFLDKAIALNSEFKYQYLRSKAYYLSYNNKANEAIDVYKSAIDEAKDDNVKANILIQIGLLYRNRLKDFDKSLIYLKKALEIDPKNSEALYRIAKLNYLHLNNQIEAKRDFFKVIELEKEKKNDLSYLTPFSYIFLDNRQEAIFSLEKTKKRYEELQNIQGYYYNVACAYGLMADEPNAIKYLDLAIENGYDNFEWMINDEDFEFVKYKKSFIDLMAKHNIEYSISDLSIEEIIKKEVKAELSKWIVKGEFETNEMYQNRMKTREQKVTDFQNIAMNRLMNEQLSEINFKSFKLGRYDAESETFKLEYTSIQPIFVKVPLSEAPSFKQNQQSLKFTNKKMVVSNNQWILSSLDIVNPSNGKSYKYDITKNANYDPRNLFALNYGDFELDIDKDIQTGKVKTGSSKLTAIQYDSDVDKNIPKSATQNENSFAVVIGNQNYEHEIEVDFALNDATIFHKYVVNTLGVPENQAHLIKNASLGEILHELDWLSNIAKGYQGEAKIIFYYAGHGMPDQSSKDAFILPVDGYASNTRTAIKLQEIYSQLNE